MAMPVPSGQVNEDPYIREVLNDYWICIVSREASLLARKEVLSGKAKFGIIGDGKEVPQVALARAYRKGDFRSGYYRDQTMAFALGVSSLEDFFAQLYADAQNDPFSGGRQMNNHFATPLIDKEGNWTSHKDLYNVSSDISATGGQMSRALGLALASKKYRERPELAQDKFSDNGNEVTFVTIGDASTSEGVFWETMNAAGVLKVPMAVSVWDDGYGISVPKEYQTTKGSISTLLEGFRVNKKGEGIDIYVAKGWDYPTLCELYEKGIEKMRKTHIPALFHIEELTQPQGHSTSGSHERYKSKERLEWEREHDCILVMRRWVLSQGLATEEELVEMEEQAKEYARTCRHKAWANYATQSKQTVSELNAVYDQLITVVSDPELIHVQQKDLNALLNPFVSDIFKNAKRTLYMLKDIDLSARKPLIHWMEKREDQVEIDYHSNLYSQSPKAALKIKEVKPIFSESSVTKNGYEVLNTFWDKSLEQYPHLFAFGEDVGRIGGVNQAFVGMQEKYGEYRVFDTGIREWTIMGQASGMCMRGLRTIAEIQYLDYLIYGLVQLSDDVATLRYRTNGIQQAPMIVRTRGHRLEGIWHAGSPMGMMLHSLRGMYILTPRNFVQAAGMYNTMLQSDDPAIVVECLNGYRLKETMPDNMGEYTVPLGIPEVLSEGTDLTLVTYGSCIRVAQEAMKLLSQHDISVELIDVQTLMPFDINAMIVESLKKTNRILFLDEDVPGGGSAYMMQEVIEKQRGYRYLDSAPKTLSAYEHRTPYGTDGDYFTKPNPEQVFETIYEMMHEANPEKYCKLY
jgi:pyruvate/2-oxoglutarate/acetoin dehydrogenase E1 component/TPP-dependent pyruvate/acetoin dehydrogenase alpha subunit